MNIKIAIEHDRNQIHFLSKTVRYLCVLAEVDDHPSIKNIELALVELLTNIIDHGESKAASEITVHCQYNRGQFTIDVSDSCQPLSSEQALAYTNEQILMPDINGDVDFLPESGWGINLIKSVCDQVSYQRKNQCNNYQLTFDLYTVECEQ